MPHAVILRRFLIIKKSKIAILMGKFFSKNCFWKFAACSTWVYSKCQMMDTYQIPTDSEEVCYCKKFKILPGKSKTRWFNRNFWNLLHAAHGCIRNAKWWIHTKCQLILRKFAIVKNSKFGQEKAKLDALIEISEICRMQHMGVF